MNKKLSIVIPFRDRDDHLSKLAPHLKAFTLANGVEADIFVIEQYDDKPFNRGKLSNVGFDLTKEKYDYFCFHDVDLVPVNSDCDYSYLAGAAKLSYYVSQFNFVPRPECELGGVMVFDKKSYQDVNGYSNEYWGWGAEDDDLGERCRVRKIPLIVRRGRYTSLYHKPNGDTNGHPTSILTRNNRNHFNKIKNTNKLFDSGLSNLEYEKVEEEESEFYIKVKVKL